MKFNLMDRVVHKATGQRGLVTRQPGTLEFVTVVWDGDAPDAYGMTVATSDLRKEKCGAIVSCEWFALCDHEAVWLVEHPALGEVPTCERCCKRFDMYNRARPIREEAS